MKIQFKSSIQLFYFLMLPLAGVLLMSSCKKDGCTDPESVNYDKDADKDDGSCEYARDKFLGTYDATRTCPNFGNSDFILTIGVSGTNQKTVVLNYGNEYTMTATAEGTTLTIPSQTVKINNVNVSVSGSSTIDESKGELTTALKFEQAPLVENCTGTAIKR